MMINKQQEFKNKILKFLEEQTSFKLRNIYIGNGTKHYIVLVHEFITSTSFVDINLIKIAKAPKKYGDIAIIIQRGSYNNTITYTVGELQNLL